MKEFVTARIDAMEEVPAMFAVTREGYLMQLWVLLEVAGVPVDTIRERLGVRVLGNNGDNGIVRLDDDFVVRALAAARELLAEV